MLSACHVNIGDRPEGDGACARVAQSIEHWQYLVLEDAQRFVELSARCVDVANLCSCYRLFVLIAGCLVDVEGLAMEIERQVPVAPAVVNRGNVEE